jgi:hypothetical protein
MFRDGGQLRPADHHGVMDLRPMVWDAAMVAPASDADVTVVLRVTYRTLAEIVDDLCAVTKSAASRPH